MTKISSLLFFLIISITTMAQSVNYELGMEDPHKHYFQVKMIISGFEGNDCLVKMPVWTPGSYKIREYGRYVENVTARIDDQFIAVEKQNKNSWLIKNEGSESFVIEYEIYAFQENIRMSFLDESHAFVTGTTVFMYVDGQKELQGEVLIKPWKEFTKISTSLPSAGENKFSYTNYDHLVDCPIEIGNQTILSYNDHGVEYEIAMYGEANYKEKKLIEDMKKITAEATKVFGQNPNDRYVFIVHNTQSRGGGIEHSNSTVLQINRDSYEPEAQYERFLGLVAHEYFHVWNVKRIRAEAMGPFNYDAEIYTDLLWLFEGFTSYYDKLLMFRAGYKTRDEFLNAILGALRAVESQPGNQVQSLRESSLDTWVKAYITDENSINTTISYYSKGSLVAMLLDLEIAASSDGKKNLDDFMRRLYVRAEAGAKPISYRDVVEVASEVCGKDMSKKFMTWVERPGTLDYNSSMSQNGLKLSIFDTSKLSLGIGVGSNAYVSYVLRNSPAEQAGIYAGDILLSINSQPLSEMDLAEVMENEQQKDSWKVILIRKGVQKTVRMQKPKFDTFQIDLEITNEELVNNWLN